MADFAYRTVDVDSRPCSTGRPERVTAIVSQNGNAYVLPADRSRSLQARHP